MPIDRQLFYRDDLAARAFVESRSGVILHEVGHYVAANVESLIGGHLIIEHRDHANSSGAFAMNEISQARLTTSISRCAFVTAAGAVTEQHFCNYASNRRLGPDMDAYRSLPTINRYMTAAEVGARWKHDYRTLIEKIAGCIDLNFNRCLAYCVSTHFLLGDYHVIPTCRMMTPRRRGIAERIDEIVWTYPRKERIAALERYLAERQRFRPHDKNQSIYF